MDFSNFKFRCSSLGKLMVNPRSKSETLSETTKSYLSEIFIEEVYGRTKDITSKYLEKGIYVEEDSLSLATKHYNKLLMKNRETLENEYIKGTPDILNLAPVLDIKSSWDIWTFMAVDGKDKGYYAQLQGYMALTGRHNADLAYCLVDTPEHIIVSEKSKQMYKLGLVDGTPEYDAMEYAVDHSMRFGDIPAEKRIKVFTFEFDPVFYEAVIERVKAARIYLNSLSL